MDRGFFKLVSEWRCLYLLVAILTLLALYPYLLGEAWGNRVYNLLFIAVMLLGVFSVSHTRAQMTVAGMFTLPAIFSQFTSFGLDPDSLEPIVDTATIVFFFLMAGLVLRYVFVGHGRIGDRLCGALSVYLLMGVGFAELYQAMYAANPEAFTFARSIENELLVSARFLYLSFVTQTTIGYGDVTPRTMATESLTILQASIGVLYVAVLVSWLVGSIRPAGEER